MSSIWVHKIILLRSSKSCNCVTVRVLKYLLSTFSLYTYTPLPYDLIKAKVLSLVNLYLNIEPKTYLCTSDKTDLFSNKK